MIWYLLVYLKVVGSCIDKFLEMQTDDVEKADNEKDKDQSELQ